MSRTFIHQDLTGGRWIPSWLRHQQATRYMWAESFVSGKRVLEVGCGSGAGCLRLLSAGAGEVMGIDVDADAVRLARDNHSSQNLEFEVVRDSQFPVADGGFDVVVALETIEHVQNDVQFVEELARVLNPGGILLLSTPNRLITNPATSITDRPLNPLHVREYTRRELGSLLENKFEDLDWYGQTFFLAGIPSMLNTIGRVSPAAAVRVRQAMRLALSPLDTSRRHQPRPTPDGREGEVLVLKCGKSSPDEQGRQTDG